MSRLLITLLASLMSAAYLSPLHAADLRPVTHEDVWLMKRLGTPVASPNGALAVVRVTEPSYEKDGTVSDLWLLDIVGSKPPLRLTSSPESENDVAWSPDGSMIAFSASREEDLPAQVYVLNIAGPGEAHRITDISTGAKKPVWSPDGERIAFESRVYPGAGDDAANRAEKEARESRDYNVSAYDSFPVRQWDHWRDDLQTHLFVQDAKAGAPAIDLLHGSALVAESGFSGVPTRSADSLHAIWTPDGEALVISATTNRDQAAYAPVLYQLYRVPGFGGVVTQLTSDSSRSCSAAQFSKDGEQLFCRVRPQTEHLYDVNEVGRFDWNGKNVSGAMDILTEGFDRSVSSMAVSDDGATVYVTANDEGRVRVFAVSVEGRETTRLSATNRGVFAGPVLAGNRILARWESSSSPAEIVSLDIGNGQHSGLTDFNSERATGLDRPEFLEFWFENDAGHRVHNWLALPPDFDERKKYPLVLMIHGGPFASSLDADHVRWSPHLLAAPGYVVLLTDFTGSVGYGEAFSRAIEGTPLKAPGDDVLRAADEAITRYPFIDATRQAATGASYGGHLINWMQATTTRFKTLVGHAGLIDQEGQYSTSDSNFHRERMAGGPPWGDSPVWTKENPASYAENFQTPILLTVGEKDYRVPVNQTIAAWTYVQRMQVPGRLLIFHDANHWIMDGGEARYYWQEVHSWLAKYLAP
jgi:dipeptidyl aminopeptidase/acylaminoacyl peptidase